MLRNITQILYFGSLGLQQALTTLVGQDIGKCNIKSAKRYFQITQHFSFITMVICTATILFFKDSLLDVFLNDSKIHQRAVGANVAEENSIESIRKLSNSLMYLVVIGKFPDLW